MAHDAAVAELKVAEEIASHVLRQLSLEISAYVRAEAAVAALPGPADGQPGYSSSEAKKVARECGLTVDIYGLAHEQAKAGMTDSCCMRIVAVVFRTSSGAWRPWSSCTSYRQLQLLTQPGWKRLSGQTWKTSTARPTARRGRM
jgi:hypothetical protein